MGPQRWCSAKESACQYRRHMLSLESGRSPGVGPGNLLQYSCLENSIGKGAWQAWDRKELDMNEHTAHTVEPLSSY